MLPLQGYTISEIEQAIYNLYSLNGSKNPLTAERIFHEIKE